jgi:hypothetical protein
MYDPTGIFFTPDSNFSLFNSVDSILAIVTLAVQKSQPDSALADELLQSLIQRRLMHQTDQNTVAAALTMAVIAPYVSINSPSSTYDLSVTANTELIYEGNSASVGQQGGLILNTESDYQTPWLSISRGEGDGRLYFVIIPMTAVHNAPATEINIEHSIYDRLDNCRPGFCTPIESWEEADLSNLYAGRITLTVHADQQHILVTLPLPPSWTVDGAISASNTIGITPENPLALGISQGTFEAMIDDRNQTLNWFTPQLSAGTYELLYYFTNNSPEAFSLPPVTVDSPYEGKRLAETRPINE